MNDIDDCLENVFFRLLREARRESREIHVFDFDDTLVKTSSRIKVTQKDGKEFFLTPMEYAKYSSNPGDAFDYSEFEEVTKPLLVPRTFLKLKKAIQESGVKNVFILTARGNPDPIRKFLDSVGVENIRIFAVGTSNPQAKADVIEDEVVNRGIRRVYFYDDAAKNIRAVRRLRQDLPGVQIIAVKVG